MSEHIHPLASDISARADVKPGVRFDRHGSGRRDDPTGLSACLKALRSGDSQVVWKLDRLGRDLRQLVDMGDEAGRMALPGDPASMKTMTENGRLVFAIFAKLAEFECDLNIEFIEEGMASTRARNHHGGRPYKMTPAKLRRACAAMVLPETKVGDLCEELGISRQTLYRFVSPEGALRPDGTRLLYRCASLR